MASVMSQRGISDRVVNEMKAVRTRTLDAQTRICGTSNPGY
jgi:hypothetical protein